MTAVSIIVPCYNEQETIRLLLEAVRGQTYPLDQMEVVIADGMSSDKTRAVISQYQQEHPDLKIQLVNNPQRNIPSALNHAIRAAGGEIIIRLDAHSVPGKDYVERCVTGLQAGLGDNVGGVWDIQPWRSTWQARSIAAAAAHPMGVGGARYRYASQPAYVDTVPFGAFYRSLFDRVGLFDETLLTNEDYELNVRIRQAGGKIWMDPAIKTVYFARPTLASLARQYWRYGFWKGQMLRRYPETIQWRQALPPLFVLGLVGLALLALFWPFARWLLLLAAGGYALVLVAGGIHTALRKRDPGLLLGVPLAIAVMHFCWGSAAWFSLAGKSSKK